MPEMMHTLTGDSVDLNVHFLTLSADMFLLDK